MVRFIGLDRLAVNLVRKEYTRIEFDTPTILTQMKS
jgi:hypothetical protein